MAHRATVAIHSLGEMGVGFARLLRANGYRVLANVEGRSSHTINRAKSAQVETRSSFAELLPETDYVLSIVPPANALSTAQEVAEGLNQAPDRTRPICYMDLNAISPGTARQVADVFGAKYPFLTVLDGGIIGSPPKEENGDWKRPSVVLSGSKELAKLDDGHFSDTLHARHVGADIGAASGLKMCFASLTKGFTALAIQSFTTAEQMGVLGELKEHLSSYAPAFGGAAERLLVDMPPKAYRWVREMEEIAETMQDNGGFAKRGKAGDGQAGDGGDLFTSIAEIYTFVADKTELGNEHVDDRKLGKSSEDVARVCAANLKPKIRLSNE